MSMDDTYMQMKKFEQNLRSFNDELKSSMRQLETQHENISPLWQDDMRKHYDAVWGPFLATMKHYIKTEGPSYVEFLNIKIHALGRYLHG